MFCHFASVVLCLIWFSQHPVGSFRLTAPRWVEGEEGGSVTVPCQYGAEYQGYTKYWCKGDVYEYCQIIVKTPRPRPHNRTFIVDDRAGFFNVTMTSLRKSDEGKYWCVIARRGRNIYTGVNILVELRVETTPAPATVSPGQDEVTWWAALRWILFILMLSCLGATHIIVWRIHAQ